MYIFLILSVLPPVYLLKADVRTSVLNTVLTTGSNVNPKPKPLILARGGRGFID